ncbi:MAG: CHASE2 domain-containing protein [Campylobacterales bacterium]
MLKKLKNYGFIGLVIFFACSIGYLYLPKSVQVFDDKLRDLMFVFRGPTPASKDVVIVDIDEKSLKELGQWPWSRNKFAKVLDNLAANGAGAIGLDIVFAEPDNSSPAKVLKEIGYDASNAPDYDRVAANAVANSPTILGYIFALENDGMKPTGAPNVAAIVAEKNKPEVEFLASAHRAVMNTKIIQEAGYSSGFFNTIPDSDGIVRSIPMVLKYENRPFPSLSLEMIRAASGYKKIDVYYDENGVQGVVMGEMEIPTDRFGRLLINYRGPAKTFKYISAYDVYAGKVDKKDIEGKFILVGTSAAGLLDLRATPFDSVYPGVEAHANAIDNIIKGDFLYRPSWAEGANLALILAGVAITVTLTAYASAALGSALFVAILFSFVGFEYYMLFHEGIVLNILFPFAAMLLSFMSLSLMNYFLESRQKDFIKAKFAKKVSPAVVEDLLKHSNMNSFEIKEKFVTIFFSDIRGFTTLSEAMGSPKALIGLLNEYMTPMVDIIVESKGTVDKFIGDAIMAYWNAPNEVENHEDAAVGSAVRQLRSLSELNKRLLEEGKPKIEIGIGINTGDVTVGEMGSYGRADYTIIGDPVNLASRLEGLCKPYHAHIVISEFTKSGLKNDYTIRELDLVRVKGKNEPVSIYEVLDDKAPSEEFKIENTRYQEALSAYRASLFTEALSIFKELHDKTGVYLYNVYIERCEHYIENPPSEFDGVFTFTTK